MPKTVICELCGVEFQHAISDEHALAEAQFIFGEELGDDPGVVCQDCFDLLCKDDPWLAAQALRFKQQN